MLAVEDEHFEDPHGVLVVDLVYVKSNEYGAKCSAHRKVALPQMFLNLWVVLNQFLLNLIDQLHKLWHILRVDPAPILSVQEISQAPESFLLVLNMHQEHGCHVVQALDVTNLGVVVRKGQEHIEKHALPLLCIPGEVNLVVCHGVVCESPRHILLDPMLFLRVVKVYKLRVYLRRVHRLLSLNAAEHAPYLAPEAIRKPHQQ